MGVAAKKKRAKAKRKVGRPSSYSEKLADRICLELVKADCGLQGVLDAIDEFPSYTTIWNWQNAHPEFLEKLTRARASQAERQMGEAYQNLVNATPNPDDDPRIAGVAARHAQGVAELSIKMAQVRAPRQYGKRLEVEHSADEGLIRQLDEMAKRVGEDL